MDRDALTAFFFEHFPTAARLGFAFVAVHDDGVELVLDTAAEHLRPGGTVSGPTLMALADTAMYASLLARLGLPAATSVTSNLEMHFLRRPLPGRLTVRCRLLKVGRRLAVGTIAFSNVEGESTGDDLCAHATVTYAL